MKLSRKIESQMEGIAYCSPVKAAKLLPDLWAARRAESWAERTQRERYSRRRGRKARR